MRSIRNPPTNAKNKARLARLRDLERTAAFAKQVGVTAAGLSWLARAVVSEDGHATQRGNEATRLVRDHLAEETGKEYRSGSYIGQIRYVTITTAGREIVRRARELGW